MRECGAQAKFANKFDGYYRQVVILSENTLTLSRSRSFAVLPVHVKMRVLVYCKLSCVCSQIVAYAVDSRSLFGILNERLEVGCWQR